MQGVIGETVKPWNVEGNQNRGIFAYDFITKRSGTIYYRRFIEKSAFCDFPAGTSDRPRLTPCLPTWEETRRQRPVQGPGPGLALTAARL
jgi:hypothetical protein